MCGSAILRPAYERGGYISTTNEHYTDRLQDFWEVEMTHHPHRLQKCHYPHHLHHSPYISTTVILEVLEKNFEEGSGFSAPVGEGATKGKKNWPRLAASKARFCHKRQIPKKITSFYCGKNKVLKS